MKRTLMMLLLLLLLTVVYAMAQGPDFDYASPILDFSIFRGQNRHFCPRLVSFEHQTRA